VFKPIMSPSGKKRKISKEGGTHMGKRLGRPPLTREQKAERVFNQLIETERKLAMLEADLEKVKSPSIKAHIQSQIRGVEFRKDRLRQQFEKLKGKGR